MAKGVNVSEQEMNAERIKRLPDSVINQIKAGEVVERPLSVVKELVENALDAGSDEISVDIFDGGKSLIRVTDTGEGMSSADARRAVERHATSKITMARDIETVASFGFRGEALASIAAVSRFELKTRTAAQSVGVNVSNDSRKELDEGFHTTAVAVPVGTQIEVRDLFHNVPARQKFLKSTSTEYAHIHDFLQAMAFAFPRVTLQFSHNRRRVFQFRKDDELSARARKVLGEEFSQFVELSYRKGNFELSGYASHPTTARSVPRHFTLFVNGRLVKDKVIRAGVLQAYSGLVMKGLVPSVILFVQCPPEWVDVNAHPSKTEVRFHDPLVVQDLVCLGVQEAVQKVTQELAFQGASPRESAVDHFPRAQEATTSQIPRVLDGAAYQQRAAAAVERIEKPQDTFQSRQQKSDLSASQPLAPLVSREPHYTPEMSGQALGPEPADQELFTSGGERKPAQSGLWGRYLGQFAKCYLLIQQGDDLLVVDQHAFHERVLFEEYRRAAQSEPIARQGLLTPFFVPVPESCGPLLDEQKNLFADLGFDVEWVPRMKALAVHSIPGFLRVGVAERVVDEVITRVLAALDPSFEQGHPLFARVARVREGWQEEGRSFASVRSTDMYHLYYSTVACHSAVRAGEEMSEDQVSFLLSRAEDVDFSAHCPHGRPVIRRFSEKDVSSWFQRI